MSGLIIDNLAMLSEDRVYRYWLRRHVADRAGGASVNFIMLNPSSADETNDDPTIRRCIGFARAWGYDRLDVTNLFAYRATKPVHLYAAPDPVGPGNDGHLLRVAQDAAVVVAAWGVLGGLRGRAGAVSSLLAGIPVWCLGTTKAGAPRHPLYAPRASKLVRWWGPA